MLGLLLCSLKEVGRHFFHVDFLAWRPSNHLATAKTSLTAHAHTHTHTAHTHTHLPMLRATSKKFLRVFIKVCLFPVVSKAGHAPTPTACGRVL